MSNTEPESSPTWTCPSCGAPASSPFCPLCGERRVFDSGFWGNRALSHGLHAPWFGRLRASLRALASPPGRLTADWVRGRRVPYLPPLTLFLWTNVMFFAVQSVSGLGVLSWPLQAHLRQDLFGPLSAHLLAIHHPAMGGAEATYGRLFDALESVHAKSLVILMVPVFALALRVTVANRDVRFSECVTFALHLYTFALIWFCALFPGVAIGLRLFIVAGGHVTTEGVDAVVSLFEAVVIGWYIAVALANVWNLPRWRRLGSALLLVSVMVLLLRPYHFVVFAVTLFST